MPFRAYPVSVSALMATYLEKAIAKLKQSRGPTLAADDTEARNDIIDGMLNEYDHGERREERIIAAGIRRFNALDWSLTEPTPSKKTDSGGGDAHSD